MPKTVLLQAGGACSILLFRPHYTVHMRTLFNLHHHSSLQFILTLSGLLVNSLVFSFDVSPSLPPAMMTVKNKRSYVSKNATHFYLILELLSSVTLFIDLERHPLFP